MRTPSLVRTFRAAVALLLVAGGIVDAPAAAENYPTRPIRFIVPFPPGGGTDIYARIIGPKLAEALRQQVVVDNRAGAAGALGAEVAAKAPADGYTLYVGGTALVVTPLLGKVPYSARDFAPISRLASTMDRTRWPTTSNPRRKNGAR